MSKRPLLIDLCLYVLSALFALSTALWSTLEPHRHWGAVAAVAYGSAAVVTLTLAARVGASWFQRALVVGSTAVAVTAIPILAQAVERAGGAGDRAQEEVVVVEQSALRLLQTGSPYLRSDAIAGLEAPLLGYNPYQPGMPVFGLPAAVFGQHWWTDARIYFLLATVACFVAAARLLRDHAGKGTLLRAFQAGLVFPVCALTLSTGGDDMPVVALMVLALAYCARERWLAAGLAIGAAGALKLFAWPVAVVLAFLAWRTHRDRGESGGAVPGRFLIGFAVPVAATMLPVLAADFRGFYDNVVAFGLGHGVVESPAQSPFPGNLIANHLPGGEVIAPALLGLAAVAIAALLLGRPPATAAAAAVWSASGLTAAFLLMPSTRFGYLLYPVVLLGWWLPLRDASGRRGDPEEAAVGPSAAVEWWR